MYFIGAVNQHPNDHNKAMAKKICKLFVHFTAVLKWMGWERACRVRYILLRATLCTAAQGEGQSHLLNAVAPRGYVSGICTLLLILSEDGS